jgi:hypothetical protein
MNCKEAKYYLADAVSGRISERDRTTLDEHLKSCKNCAAEIESLQRMFSRVTADKPWAPPEAYWNNLLPRIHKRIASQPARGSLIPIWLTRLAVPAGAAVLLLFLSRVMPGATVAVSSGEGDQELHAIVGQLSDAGIQQVEDVQAVDNYFEPAIAYEQSEEDSIADRQVLIDFLKDDGPVDMVSGYENSLPLDTLSAPEMGVLLSMLDQKSY